MKIDIFCNDGSPIGVSPELIWTRGVGGAELALMTWARFMAKRGHKITIYNDPKPSQGLFEGVQYTNKSSFKPLSDRDIFIVWRSLNPITQYVQAKKKIFWSCDQYTNGDFRKVFPMVDEVVLISDFHKVYFQTHYNQFEKLNVIDLGVDVEQYKQKVDKIKGRMIFCSIPDRGLDIVKIIWPKIKAKFPELSLVITSDYTLWGSQANNQRHRLAFARLPDVQFLGNIPREQLIEEQLKAELMFYPCTYEELFCISAAECAVAGALPVTSDVGALATTNKCGILVQGNPVSPEWQNRYLEKVSQILTDGVQPFAKVTQKKAIKRFNWERICDEWETLLQK